MSTSSFFVNSYNLLTACCGLIIFVLLIKFKDLLSLHSSICLHHFEIFSLFDFSKFGCFFFKVRINDFKTFVTSPTIGKSTFTILLIEDGSTSICIFFDFGENSSIFPVIRSSNRAPMLINKSQSCIALFASKVPCIPSMPINWLSSPG